MVHTHARRSVELINAGSIWAEYWEIDITSLDEKGAESGIGLTDFNLHYAYGVSFLSRENPEYRFSCDVTTDSVLVNRLDNASQVSAGTDVGTLSFFVFGW